MKGDKEMLHLYRKEAEDFEYCFNVETSAPLTAEELAILKRILAHGFIENTIQAEPTLDQDPSVMEVGPLLNFATAFHTNVSQICDDIIPGKVVRIERSRRAVK